MRVRAHWAPVAVRLPTFAAASAPISTNPLGADGAKFSASIRTYNSASVSKVASYSRGQRPRPLGPTAPMNAPRHGHHVRPSTRAGHKRKFRRLGSSCEVRRKASQATMPCGSVRWIASPSRNPPQMFYLTSRNYRCIAHDRRGHGRSSQPWNGNDLDTYADDLAELVAKLDLKDAVHVGHSTGGGLTTIRSYRSGPPPYWPARSCEAQSSKSTRARRTACAPRARTRSMRTLSLSFATEPAIGG